MHEFMLEWAAAWLRAVAFPVVKLLEQPAVEGDFDVLPYDPEESLARGMEAGLGGPVRD